MSDPRSSATPQILQKPTLWKREEWYSFDGWPPDSKFAYQASTKSNCSTHYCEWLEPGS